MGEQDLRSDDTNYRKDMELRAEASEAYHQAAISDKLRAAMLARSRLVRREYALGEWCYYWRAAKDSLEAGKSTLAWSSDGGLQRGLGGGDSPRQHDLDRARAFVVQVRSGVASAGVSR